jgi:hypothetical protein
MTQARYGPDATRERRLALLRRLDEFGLFDLDVGRDVDQLLIAGWVLRALGGQAIALPLPALTSGRAAGLPGPLHAIGGTGTSVMIDGVDLGLPAFTIDRDGIRSLTRCDDHQDGSRVLARFAAPAELIPDGTADPRWWALHQVLTGFLVLGVLDQLVSESRRHLNEREQFGQPLKAFQSLAHRYAGMVVRQAGLAELCLFTAWAFHHRPGAAVVDTLALRLYAVDALIDLSRDAHQIHAAIGFCHEHPLADLTASMWLVRAQPLTPSQTAEALADQAGEIEMLFSGEVAVPTFPAS